MRARRATDNACGNTVGINDVQKNAAIAWIRHATSPRQFHPAIRAGIRACDFGAPPSHVHEAHSGVWRAATASAMLMPRVNYRCGGSTGIEHARVRASASTLETQAIVFKNLFARTCFPLNPWRKHRGHPESRLQTARLRITRGFKASRVYNEARARVLMGGHAG